MCSIRSLVPLFGTYLAPAFGAPRCKRAATMPPPPARSELTSLAARESRRKCVSRAFAFRKGTSADAVRSRHAYA